MLKRTVSIALVLLAGGLVSRARDNSQYPTVTEPLPTASKLGPEWTYDQVPSAGVNSWYSSTYHFTLDEASMLSVVDAYIATDIYRVYDNGNLILTTAVPSGVGHDHTTSDPNVAWADDQFSQGSVVLQAFVEHNITIQSDIQTGVKPAGFFVRLTVVPEPATTLAGALLLLPFGVSALRILRKRRKA